MNKKEYNGWYNYETWACNLWFDAGWEEEIKDAIEYAIENKREMFTIREEAAFRLEDAIKTTVEDSINPDCQNGFAGDLINAGLSEINFYEIAKHYIDDAKIYVAMWNVPGCLPEMEPAYFTDEDEARQFLSDSIEEAYDDEQEEESPELEEEIESKKAAIMRGEDVYDEGGYIYTVREA